MAGARRCNPTVGPVSIDASRRRSPNQYIASELKTSHTALFTPDDYFYHILLDVVGAGAGGADFMARNFWGTGPYYPSTGAFTREVDGHHFVDGVLEGSPADRAGVLYGDEILSVDGAPYSPIAVFRGKVGMIAKITIRRQADATPLRMQVPVVPIRPTKAFSDATAASARIIERDGRRIGYVHIWASAESNSFTAALRTFLPDQIIQQRLSRAGVRVIPNDRDAALKIIGERPKPIDGLIVDMRGRVGGNVGVASQFLQALDEGRRPFWGKERITTRSRPGEPRFVMTVGNSNPHFHGRSAMLIDGNTRSAAEMVALGFKRTGFGPVIGTPTAGAVSSGSTSVMPGELLLYVAISRMEFDGKPLEGIGVSPNHHVERPLAYAAGADPVLEAGIELLAKRTPE